jgi:anti-sigma factor RsiW
MDDQVSETDVHAFVDGELTPQAAAAVEAAMARDPVLAARVRSFQADKLALIAAYRPLARAPVPPTLLRAATSEPVPSGTGSLIRPLARRFGTRRWGRPAAFAAATALAASLLLILTPRVPRDPAPLGPVPGDAAARRSAPRETASQESPIEQALAARDNTRKPSRSLTGGDQASVQAVAQAMTDMLGNPTRVPDLQRAGFSLVSAEVYGENRSDAVQLRYEDSARRLFTVFLRPSAGPDAFEVTERGPVRICLWQNADVTAVMTGELPTPELFRLASLTYSALGL